MTSRHHPMYQVIISWTKNKYKYDLIQDLIEIYCDEGGGSISSRRGKGYDRFSQGFCPHVHDAITRMDRIWDAASEESIVNYFKKDNCMPIVVNERVAAVPAAAEPDALKNDALYYEIANFIGDLRIELIVEDDVNTRDDFVGAVFLGSSVNFPAEDIVKAWNIQDENYDQQDIVNAFLDEVC